MEILIHEKNNIKIAELKSQELLLTELDDFIDLLGNANYLGAEIIMLSRNNLHEDFFDLKTGIAGDILQKFSNYNQRLIILGDFSNEQSKSLNDFIRESNRTGRILFLESKEIALKKILSQN